MELSVVKVSLFDFPLPQGGKIPAKEWTTQDVAHFISSCTDTSKYIDVIKHHDITGSELLSLTKNDLEVIGISSMGHRIRIWNAIELLKDQNCADRVCAAACDADRDSTSYPTRSQTSLTVQMITRKTGKLACGVFERRRRQLVGGSSDYDAIVEQDSLLEEGGGEVKGDAERFSKPYH